MRDYILPGERVPKRRWLLDFISEVWWKYHLKIARFELEKAEQDIAALWRAQVVKMADRLRSLGVDPDKEPEDLTKMFEVYLFTGCVILVILCALFFMGYREELAEIVRSKM